MLRNDQFDVLRDVICECHKSHPVCQTGLRWPDARAIGAASMAWIKKGKHPKTGPRRSTPARHRGERLGQPSRIPVSNVSRSHKAPRYSTRKPSVFHSKTTLQQTASESWEEFSCPATCFHATCLLDFTNLVGPNKFQRYDHD